MLRSPWVVLLTGLAMLLPSCGPPAPTTPPGVSDQAEADDRVLEAVERRVAATIERLRESCVALEYAIADAPAGARRVATGVVISDRGDVLSIRIDPPSSSVPVVARDAAGVRHPARWVAADAETGLTLLRIDPAAARPVVPAPEAPRLGSPVLVIGNPFGLGHSVIRGQVAGLDRRVDVGPRPLGGLIQVDAALHPGDSGALVANLRGEWLGLIRSGLAVPDPASAPDLDPTAAAAAAWAIGHDLGFAIPAHDALWVAGQLRIHRRVDRAYLGVRLDLGLADASPSPGPGAVLDGVVARSPAERGGLLAGDRITAFNGRPIAAPGDLIDRLDRTPAQAEVALDYWRGPRLEHLTLRADSRPPPKPEPEPPARPQPRAAERIEQLERRVRELEEQAARKVERQREEGSPQRHEGHKEGPRESSTDGAEGHR